MAALWRGGLDEIVHQPQHILFVPQVAEGIVSVRLLQVDEVQHPDVIALALEVAARGSQHLHFGVCNDIIGVGLQDIWLHI